MIYAKALRSKYPRAIVNKIDLTKALAHPDCVRILTEKDVPNKKVGHLVTDWDVMIAEGGTTRYIGDALALVATNHKETLDEVLNLIEVDYTELTPVTCPTDALKADAPLIHERGNIMRKEILKRGDADEAIKNSKYVVTRKYRTPFNDHAFMEPECAIAMPDGEDGLFLYTGSQSVYDERHEGEDGVRVTVVRASDNAPVSISIDLTNFSENNIDMHFGKKCILQYRNGSILSFSQSQYSYSKPEKPLPRVISNGGNANIAAIKSYFCSEWILKRVAELIGASYNTLINGNYKLLIEPIAYFTFQGYKMAMLHRYQATSLHFF